MAGKSFADGLGRVHLAVGEAAEDVTGSRAGIAQQGGGLAEAGACVVAGPVGERADARLHAGEPAVEKKLVTRMGYDKEGIGQIDQQDDYSEAAIIV